MKRSAGAIASIVAQAYTASAKAAATVAASHDTYRALAECALQAGAGQKVHRRAEQRQQYDPAHEIDRERMLHRATASPQPHRNRADPTRGGIANGIASI